VSDPERTFLLPERVRPVPQPDGLDAPFWDGLREEKIVLQRCAACARYQWGPEHVCYDCGSFDVGWAEAPRPADGSYRGAVFSWERVWHAVDASLAAVVPYVVVLVELPDAYGVRLIGNLVDPPDGPVRIGAGVSPVFEHHDTHTLLLWRLASAR
jgi:uncharacterized OB-fold protein